MSFKAYEFIYDGVSSYSYDLMLYDIGSTTSGEANLAGAVGIVEDIIGSRWKPYFYGIQFKNKLSFNMVFGLKNDRLDMHSYLNRVEIHEIATWLTGHTCYKPLRILQDDLIDVWYNCMFTNLELIGSGGEQYGFKATVTCDGPYAYRIEPNIVKNLQSTSASEFSINNLSALHVPAFPKLIISQNTGTTLSIENITSGNIFEISNIPNGVTDIVVDCDKCVISATNGANLYPNCNLQWVKIEPGYNEFSALGDCRLEVNYSFPVNVGA